MPVLPQILRFNLWWTLISIIILTAAFFGGAWSLWQVFMPVALSLWGAATWRLSPAALPKPLKYGIILPVSLVLLWAFLQTLPLLGLTNPVYALVNPTLWPAISVDISATLNQLAYAASLALMSAGVYALTRQNLNTSLPVRGVAIAVLAVAVYGLFIYIGGNHSVVWLAKSAYLNSFTATFINRNHYATFAGIGTLACLALFFERAGEISSRLTWRQRLNSLWLLMVQPRWPWLVAALFLFITIVLSTSRAGLAATSVGILALMLSLAYARRALRWHFAAFIGLGVVFGLVLMMLTGAAMGSRLAKMETDVTKRGIIFAISKEAIAAQPVTGQGFGAFESIFALQRSHPQGLSVRGRIDHAHNTYLELTTELGLPSAALLATALFTALAFLLQGLAVRRRGVAWPALGIGTVVLTGGHALVDFSLSMPAVAAITLVILAFAVAQSFPHDDTQPAPTAWKGALRFIPLLALLVAPFSMWQAFAEFPNARATRIIRQLERGTPPGQITYQLGKARNNLLNATGRNPFNPIYLYNLARVETALAQARPELARPLLQAQARQHYQEALALSPANSGAWYRLAWLENARGNSTASQAYLANSLLTCAFEPRFLIARAHLMLSLYPYSSGDNQSLYARHVANLWSMQFWPLWETLKNDPTQLEQLRKILAVNPQQHTSTWYRVTKKQLLVPLGEAASPR